jgi:hypothetical protein
MSQPPADPGAASPATESTLRASLLAFAAIDLGLALFMAVAPNAFYRAIGPFGAINAHYIRDVATFYAAIGLALAVAVKRPSWRVPALAVSTVQFALHTLNHLLDIGKAHPAWTGYADFFSLLAGTAALAWVWRIAAKAEQSDPPLSLAAPLPITQRSPT